MCIRDSGKDVDCFHPYNVGQLMIGEHTFLPCTPAGVMAMLDEYGIDPAGKDVYKRQDLRACSLR